MSSGPDWETSEDTKSVSSQLPADEEGCEWVGRDDVRWNARAWFGGQLGGTAWMLTAFAAYVWQLPWLGALFLAAFASINGLGFWLWSHRRRLRFFKSIQILTVLCGGSAFLALVAFDFLTPGNLKHNLIWQDGQPRWVGASRSEFRSAYLLLLVMVPALLVLFEVQGRRAIQKD